jgi:hypothetical protein
LHNSVVQTDEAFAKVLGQQINGKFQTVLLKGTRIYAGILPLNFRLLAAGCWLLATEQLQIVFSYLIP